MGNQFEEEFEDEFEIVSMEDENGIETEFVIIDNIASGGSRYLLVLESSMLEEDEADAIILKETAITADDVEYEWVDDGEEFDRISALFADREGEYDIRLDETEA